MKKTIALLLAVMMTVTVFAGCNNKTEQEGTEGNVGTSDSTTEATVNTTLDTTPDNDNAADDGTALQVLENIWSKFGEEDRFPIFGGDSSNMTDNAPGSFDVTNTEELRSVLLVDESVASQVTEAASMVHMMNANVLTVGAFRVSGDVSAFADTMKDTIANNQWLCGQPAGFLLAQVAEDTLVMTFGDTVALDLVRNNLKAAYASAEILHDDVIA